MADDVPDSLSPFDPEFRARAEFVDDLYRQIRLQVRAGREPASIRDWLQEQGLSSEAAEFARTSSRTPAKSAKPRRRKRARRAVAPDSTFTLATDSYAQIVARESRRRGWPQIFAVILAILVVLPFLVGSIALVSWR